MADVRPFRGLLYNTKLVQDLASVVSPPFDTIPTYLQDELYRRSLYNVVRLEAGEQADSDTEQDNRYTRAAATFRQWQQSDVLVRDSAPAFYLLRHDFTHEGRERSRLGLVACVRLEEYDRRVVLPHEFTGQRDKDDRLALMEACQANFSPIMVLYRDPEGMTESVFRRAVEHPPALSVSQADGQDYALWRIDEPEAIYAIRQAIASQPLYIADGHHRYETALRYNQLRPGTDPESASRCMMMVLIEFQDPGLMVLPYHRVLGPLQQGQSDAVWTALREWGEIIPVPDAGDMAQLQAEVDNAGREGLVVGLLGPRGDGPYLLKIRQRSEMVSWGPMAQSEPWLLEERILPPALGDSLEGCLSYVHDPMEADALARSDSPHIALLLKAFPLDLFQRIVDAGQKLPRKSTFFYPKLPTGLVVNSLEGTL